MGKDNGRLLIDHFIQMSQTQCSYINQTHGLYSDFLAQYQEEAANAARFEGDIVTASDGQQSSVMGQVPGQIGAGASLKELKEDENDGGSGGTTKVALDGAEEKKSQEL